MRTGPSGPASHRRGEGQSSARGFRGNALARQPGMRVAHIAPLYERVPPKLYGGTERIVSYLVEEQIRRGHEVTLFASGDSRSAAEIVAPVPRALRLDAGHSDPLVPHVVELSQVFEQADDFDLIHSHVDYLAFPFSRLVATPTVHTLHGRLDLPHLRPLMRHFADLSLVSISNAQRRPLEPLDLNWTATVYHGLPLDFYAPGPGDGHYVAFLGRIAPEKGPGLAIAAAKAAGVRLKIAAKVDPADRAYFESEIQPLLADPLIDYVGEIAEADKPRFLGEAMALLFPIDWPEPFGLVMIEALACGSPVIARPCGSVPEIITPGRTGFLADTLDEIVEALRVVDRLDRAQCRREAERRFSVERMVDDYDAVYERLATGAPLT
jgi:glycosyltransferase involved in cell wall biosynthesis